jgi:ABC-type multidrug transport system fused ATPase/permease subunit
MGLLVVVLFGVTLGAVGCVVLMEAVIVPRIDRAIRQTQEAIGAMSAALERMFGAFRTVKAAGAEEREEAQLHDAAAAHAWNAGLRRPVAGGRRQHHRVGGPVRLPRPG